MFNVNLYFGDHANLIVLKELKGGPLEFLRFESTWKK